MKINCYDALVKTLVLYLIFSWFNNLLPFPLTAIVGGILVCELLYIYCTRLTRSKVYILGIIIIFSAYTSLVTNDLVTNTEDLIRVISVFLFMGLVCDSKEVDILYRKLNDNKKLLLNTSKIISITTFVMLLMPMCYSVDVTWGENNKYFYGVTEGAHIMSGCACLYMAMYLFGIKGRKYNTTEIMYIVPPVLAVFQGGARVYLLCIAALAYMYYYTRLRNQKIKIVLIPIVLTSGILFFLNSGLMDKFLFVNEGYAPSSYSSIDRFTSGRTYFWMKDIDAFRNSNVIEQLLGHGFDFIRTVSGHSGHNDIIHMLLGIGILGCIFYVYIYVKAINNVVSKMTFHSHCRLKKYTIGVCLYVYVFAPMLLNGIFRYQHLLYSMIIIICYFNMTSSQLSD